MLIFLGGLGGGGGGGLYFQSHQCPRVWFESCRTIHFRQKMSSDYKVNSPLMLAVLFKGHFLLDIYEGGGGL